MPISAEDNITDYVDLSGYVRADCVLTRKGDSMINAGIRYGDIVCSYSLARRRARYTSLALAIAFTHAIEY